MGGVVQKIFQGRGDQTGHGGGVRKLLPFILLLVPYGGLLFGLPSNKPVLWFSYSFLAAVLLSYLSLKRKEGHTLEALVSWALLVAGLVQFLALPWLHIIYIPFLVFLSLFFGPEIMIPLGLAVPALEVKHFVHGNRAEEVFLSAAAVLTAAVVSMVHSRMRRERDSAGKALTRVKEEAEDFDSGKDIDGMSSESLASQHLSSTNKANEEIREILLLAAHLLPSDSVSLFELKGDSLTFRCSFPSHAGEEIADAAFMELCVRKRGAVVSGPDPSDAARSLSIAIPVLDGNFISGVLLARRKANGGFTGADIKTLELLSQQVVKVLYRQRVFSHINREHAGLKILHGGSSSLIMSLKLEEIAHNLIEAAYKIAPLSIAFFMARGSRHELIHQVGLLPPEDRLVDFSNTLVGMAIRNREPIYFSNLRENRIPVLPFKSGHVGSIFMLPLTYEREPLGILLFLSGSGGALNSYQLELLGVLGNQAASSLENAKLYAEIERLAVTDGLTGLYNHRHFQEKLAAEFRRLERFASQLSLLLVDIDFFKKVNDTHGHPAGDEILRRVAGILNETVRNVDMPARYGGEEFAAILPGTDREGAGRMAERLRRSVMDRTFSFEGKELKVTVSIGSATFPGDAESKEELIEKADRALYHAKRNGRNRCVSWEEIKGKG